VIGYIGLAFQVLKLFLKVWWT